ncbi:MAG: TetR/AcrR family transcriptional regulator [Chloroflexi bacterium]|nr:TetR/AcrR family transcriptional regulator [Chloroflexota bacterium]
MARVFKEEEYKAKRDQILDVAMSLVYSKGYEQMTIQDILDGLKISRGAFYHYFDSKQALLEALIERSPNEVIQTFLPMVQDPHLSAIQKIQSILDASTRWKTAQKELILSALKIWYSDKNALIRQRMVTESLKHMSRLLEPIIRQGIEEKVFTTSYPAEVAVIFTGVALSLSDSLVELMLTPHPDQETFQKAQTILKAYFDSIERILGAPSGSFKVLDVEVFRELFMEP